MNPNSTTKEKRYIASCSFGKDSIATILIALKHGEPLDAVVFAEVMFDHENGISGELPEHIEWIYNTAIPKLSGMGVKVDVVRSNKDYKWFFTNQLRRSEQYKGKYYGFPLGGMCIINRECKLKPIRDYYKSYAEYEIVQYIGIAKDETKRLSRLKRNQISLLEKYNISEAYARAICREAGLLSPIYEHGTRGGCWFCMNARLPQYIKTRHDHPHMWEMLRNLSHTPNLCSYGFKYGKTLQEVEKQMDRVEWMNERQMKFEF